MKTILLILLILFLIELYLSIKNAKEINENKINKYLNYSVCRLFGHKYTLKRNITPYLKEIKCERCKKEFGMNDKTQSVLPLDNDLKKLHNELLMRLRLKNE